MNMREPLIIKNGSSLEAAQLHPCSRGRCQEGSLFLAGCHNAPLQQDVEKKRCQAQDRMSQMRLPLVPPCTAQPSSRGVRAALIFFYDKLRRSFDKHFWFI